MLETIIQVLSSAAGGGVLGLVGSYFKSRQEWKGRELEIKHSLAMRKLDREDIKLEAELQFRRVGLESEIQADINAGKLQEVSYNADEAKYGGGIVDAVRGLMRPLITTYLLVYSSFLGYKLHELLGGLDSLPEVKLFELYMTLVTAAIFLTTTAVTWWFGSRPTTKPGNTP